MIPLLFVDDCSQEITPFFYREEGYLVFSHSQGWTMMLDQCAHLHIPLSTGWIEGQCVVCPWHQWKYNAEGHCVWPPASSDGVPVFPIQEDKGILWLLSTETTSTWISHLFSHHWHDMEKVAAMKHVHMIGYKETTRVWCAGADLEEAQSRLDEICALYLPH